jgi:hypothetical protein
MRKLSRLLLLGVAALLVGCASAPKVGPQLSEQMRQLAELRDVCTQYAAWAARDLKPESPELRRVQELYIAASAAANGYIEALQFDVAVGTSGPPQHYADVVQRVHDSSDAFLKETRRALGVSQTRGLPLLMIIPLVEGLLTLSQKVNDTTQARHKQERELIVRVLSDKKWKPFNELVR